MRIALRTFGVLLMLAGVYVVFFRETAGSLTSTELPASAGVGLAVSPQAGDGPEPLDMDQSGGVPSPPTATVTTTIDPFRPVTAAPSTTVASSDETAAAVWDDSSCDLTFNGYGVEMKAWGDILLPYAVGFPTSDPGEPPDCAPKTDFGGAIVAAHLAYLDVVRPELIPQFAVAGEGLTRRLDEHPGPIEPDTLGYVCEPLGWRKHDDGAFLIFHLCGDSNTKVTKVPLTTVNGRWQVEYPPDGVFEWRTAAGAEAYYPFAGGE